MEKGNFMMKNIKKIVLALAIYLPLTGATASAATSIWTVSHGGTGKIQFNDDGTYYSTCVPFTDYVYAVCPSDTGTYIRGTGGNAQYLFFNGSDGKQVAYRISGTSTNPDSTLTQITNGQYYNGLIIKKGDTYTCSEFYDSIYNFNKGPVAYECANSMICVAGSNDVLGALSSNYVFVSETSPGYFVKGRCSSKTKK